MLISSFYFLPLLSFLCFIFAIACFNAKSFWQSYGVPVFPIFFHILIYLLYVVPGIMLIYASMHLNNI